MRTRPTGQYQRTGSPKADSWQNQEGDAKNWQGQQDSNPRPTVLETVALPTELYPYRAGAKRATARLILRPITLVQTFAVKGGGFLAVDDSGCR